jgi:hypothetical protein
LPAWSQLKKKIIVKQTCLTNILNTVYAVWRFFLHRARKHILKITKSFPALFPRSCNLLTEAIRHVWNATLVSLCVKVKTIFFWTHLNFKFTWTGVWIWLMRVFARVSTELARGAEGTTTRATGW